MKTPFPTVNQHAPLPDDERSSASLKKELEETRCAIFIPLIGVKKPIQYFYK